MDLSDGERLIILMLADVSKTLKLKGEMDPEFIANMIFNDTLWAIRWKYHGIPFSTDDDPPEVSQTCDILDLWMFLEDGYKQLSKADKERIKSEAAPFGENVVFRGFDGNHEAKMLSVARVLIDDLGRWPQFRGRELNAHARTVDRYLRMCRAFESIRPRLDMRSLNADEIITILRAQKHA
ncbi:YfbU family protein [Bradyrhizobium sp. STM 3809]|uniref:YfbU family protein n=1 Tax=Bradyrhizobium sp. STM 3809 TaxID=551936 RepID=UPI000558A071|nr:YfbU family protein [Bradyrhizobium sp. STM 3809]